MKGRLFSEQDRNYGISLLRFGAMCMIVACHILRYYDNWFAWWLNVGVQIFLFLSGYLYAAKEISDRFAFWKKNFLKLLVDYYLFLLLSFPFFLIFAKDQLPLSGILHIFTFSGETIGYGHLWFVPYILLCYLLTPFLHDVFARWKRIWLIIFLSCVVTELAGRFFFTDWNPAWLNCYLIGFSVQKLQRSGCSLRRMVLVMLPFMLVTNGIRIYLDCVYFYQFENKYLEFFYWIVYDYSHVFLGAFLCLAVFAALDGVRFPPRLGKTLDFLNRYSYDVYLCHYSIMLGPLTLLGLTPFPWLNVSIVLLLTCVFAVILYHLSEVVKTGLSRRRRTEA